MEKYLAQLANEFKADGASLEAHLGKGWLRVKLTLRGKEQVVDVFGNWFPVKVFAPFSVAQRLRSLPFPDLVERFENPCRIAGIKLGVLLKRVEWILEVFENELTADPGPEVKCVWRDDTPLVFVSIYNLKYKGKGGGRTKFCRVLERAIKVEENYFLDLKSLGKLVKFGVSKDVEKCFEEKEFEECLEAVKLLSFI